MKDRILVVDDEEGMRDFLQIMLAKEGFQVTSASSGREAINYLEQKPCDLVLCDLKMTGMDGLEVLKAVKEMSPDTEVLMMTAYASVDSAVEAMRLGAFNYITKPFNNDDISMQIRSALRQRSLCRENLILKKELQKRYSFANIIGCSQPMLDIFNLIKKVSSTSASVLITGESGVGKELVARAIHFEGPRREMPFVPVNCGAMPENLIESELFGYRKGAFTGASSDREGVIEAADGGTLFLDEITEMPFHLQVKLLRFLQEGSFRRVGGRDTIAVDVRIISASNGNPGSAVKDARFREDLYYRLNVINIQVPPLRDRMDDLPLLVDFFLDKYNEKMGKDIKGVSSEALEYLRGYAYPGNVRELENTMERAVALEDSMIILPESLPPSIVESVAVSEDMPILNPSIPPAGIDMEKSVADMERGFLVEALKRAGGVKKRAAELLGISFRSLRYKLDKYGIK